MDNLDPINALADADPGFVWRLQTDEGNATALRPDADDESMIINMSVWTSIEALADYVYRSGHVAFLRRRREWFSRMDQPPPGPVVGPGRAPCRPCPRPWPRSPTSTPTAPRRTRSPSPVASARPARRPQPATAPEVPADDRDVCRA